MLGYLRETEIEAKKCGEDKDTHICRNGLDTYLKVIFPDTDDWIYNKPFGGSNKKISRKQPDYRSDSLKLIIEFDGLPHYQKYDQYIRDIEITKLYEQEGYKVVRIPYFIQLTSQVIKTLFNVNIDSSKVFPEDIPSFTKNCGALPIDMSLIGIYRMFNDFRKISLRQFDVNRKYFEEENMLDCYNLTELSSYRFICNTLNLIEGF